MNKGKGFSLSWILFYLW